MIRKEKNLHNALETLSKGNNSVLLLTAKEDRDNHNSYLFIKPIDVITCKDINAVEPSFKVIERYLAKGFFAAGYIAYEAGFAFEENLKKLFTPGPILMWLGIYKKPITIGSGRGPKEPGNISSKKYCLLPSGLSVSKDQYISCINKIKSFIASGMTYQVNYTIKKYFRFSGDPYALFLKLCDNQKVPYAAFIKNDFEYILSLSPELFFSRNNNQVRVNPMKGTAERSKQALSDWAKAFGLRDSSKDRAENLMIVDLLRNDLGKVSNAGSVKTESLFDVQRLETLWQMTSSVKAQLKTNLSWLDFFKSTFPSGSVTGAPKIKTMDIISRLENAPRGVYTGSIGYISPEKKAVFNVAIRTLRIEKNSRSAELGIGSGIVWDSRPEKEWDECRLKGNFTKENYCDFQLIETLLFKKGEIRHLDYHLDRLEESASYFDFDFNRQDILIRIKNFSDRLDSAHDYKIRVLLSKDGFLKFSSQIQSFAASKASWVVFSKKITDSRDIFLYHKTTNRNLYNQEHARWRKLGAHDCLFKNEKGEVTEGAISNIFIESGNKIFTPPLSSGLLNGTFRRHLLEGARGKIIERVLFEKDIISANKIYLTNAVSGIIPVKLKRKS